MIQIRNVPDELHRTLKVRAAQEGMSLSELLLKDARRLAEQPSDDELHRRLAALRPLSLKESPARTVRTARDSR